jgi:hypothetical protein
MLYSGRLPMALPRPNLFTHEVVKTIQEVAREEYAGDSGFDRVVVVLNQGLEPLGTDVAKATVRDYRKLFHTGWGRIANSVATTEYRELLSERFKALVF